MWGTTIHPCNEHLAWRVLPDALVCLLLASNLGAPWKTGEMACVAYRSAQYAKIPAFGWLPPFSSAVKICTGSVNQYLQDLKKAHDKYDLSKQLTVAYCRANTGVVSLCY